jgi:hypothetical protein
MVVHMDFLPGQRNSQSIPISWMNHLGSWGGNSEWSACEVAEVIFYNRVLSDSERAAVFNYLSLLYGL